MQPYLPPTAPVSPFTTPEFRKGRATTDTCNPLGRPTQLVELQNTCGVSYLAP